MQEPKKISQLKHFLFINRVPQKELSQQSGIAITSLHYMINSRWATNKTINRVVTTLEESYNIKTTFEELKKMMETDQE